MNRLLVLSLGVAITLGACSRQQEPPAASAVAAAASAPPTAAAQPSANAGKALQVMQAGAYTYAEVDWRGQRVWIAGTQIDLKPGDEVHWGPAAVMRNFEAKSLGRTFDQILFVTSWGRPGAAQVTTHAHGSPPAAPAAAAGDGAGGGIVKSVADAGGYSYIEVDRGGSTVWVAAMQTPMKPGDRIEWQGGSEMRNFTAKSLGRSFDRVVFASAVAVVR